MEIDCLQKNNKFIFKITLDRHNARLKLINCFLPYPIHFSLPSTFKTALYSLHSCKSNFLSHFLQVLASFSILFLPSWCPNKPTSCKLLCLYFWEGFFYYFFRILLNTAHMPSLRFHCADGFWDRTQYRCNWCIGSQTL